ncbi:MAG: helix-turn-helix transcriptional regulator [Actinomycetota bacterium]
MEKKPLVVRPTKDLEVELGLEIRRMRLRQNRTQRELADDANVSLSALKNLETGRGSGVRTLILVARALGRTDWLESFASPEPSISPMQMLRQRKLVASGERQRASREGDARAGE